MVVVVVTKGKGRGKGKGRKKRERAGQGETRDAQVTKIEDLSLALHASKSNSPLSSISNLCVQLSSAIQLKKNKVLDVQNIVRHELIKLYTAVKEEQVSLYILIYTIHHIPYTIHHIPYTMTLTRPCTI